MARPLLLVEYLLPYAAVRAAAPAAEVRLRRVLAGDDEAITGLLRGDDLATRLARRELGVAATAGEAIVACAWSSTAPLRLHGYGLRVTPRAGECYAYGVRVAEEHRGRGLGRAVLARLVEESAAEGVHAYRGYVNLRSRAAAALQRAVGARPVELLVGLALGGRHSLVLARLPWGRSR